jgi:hypothetical protein
MPLKVHANHRNIDCRKDIQWRPRGIPDAIGDNSSATTTKV